MPGRTVDADALRRGHVERARHRAHPDRRRYLAVAPDNPARRRQPGSRLE